MITENMPMESKLKYPLAFKSLSDGVVVLFTSFKAGIQISPLIESHDNFWTPHTDSSVWIPMNISITH